MEIENKTLGSAILQDRDINQIYAAVNDGAKVYIGRNHLGKTKIKLSRGPFGLWVQRFEANEQQTEMLKAKLGLRHPVQFKTTQFRPKQSQNSHA